MFYLETWLFVVFFLNYLIAVVSDSYDQVIENQALAVRDSRHSLNRDLFDSKFEQSEESVPIVVMSTIFDKGEETEWQGIGKSI